MTINGYIFYRGKLEPIVGIHSDSIGNLKQAIDKGYVRIRDHGQRVAFQGRSKRLVESAIAVFQETIRFPQITCMEWPGHYSEDQR
jgi:hypothetical protein